MKEIVLTRIAGIRPKAKDVKLMNSYNQKLKELEAYNVYYFAYHDKRFGWITFREKIK